MKRRDQQMEEIEKNFGPSMRALSSRPDLVKYLQEESLRSRLPIPSILVSVMLMMDLGYHPDFPKNIRLTGLTQEELLHSKRSIGICNKLRETFPQRPDMIEVLEYMRDHGGLGAFL